MASPGKFTIQAPARTDIWRKPPSTNVFNATTESPSSGPLKDFDRARLTVTLPPKSQLVQYDQGGIVFSLRGVGHGPEEEREQQWLKCGIEFYEGEPWLGTVGCDRWADWSIVPLPAAGAGERPRATVELERARDENGKGLWVYMVEHGAPGAEERRMPVREVCWLFACEDEREWQLHVSAYACRPSGSAAGGDAGELEVDIEDFSVFWKQ